MKDILRHVNVKLMKKENEMLIIEKHCIYEKEKHDIFATIKVSHHDASILDHNRKQNFGIGALNARDQEENVTVY